MNCLTYALGKFIKEGGYLMMRRSQFAEVVGIKSKFNPLYWTPHFLHRTKTGVITQYLPTEDQKERHKKLTCFKVWLSLWHFEGVVCGDDLKNE